MITITTTTTTTTTTAAAAAAAAVLIIQTHSNILPCEMSEWISIWVSRLLFRRRAEQDYRHRKTSHCATTTNDRNRTVLFDLQQKTSVTSFVGDMCSISGDIGRGQV